MFSSFTSILSPAIKEKLGLGPKPSVPAPKQRSPAQRPVKLPGNRTLRPLPTSLHTEVQSPGFSSRLSSYVREEKDASPETSSPLRSRLGVPVISLTKRSLPKLTSRNSGKYGRGEERVPVLLRMGPREPFSPFKRSSYHRSPERGNDARQSRDDHNSTDPRQVIAALAELSGKIEIYSLLC